MQFFVLHWWLLSLLVSPLGYGFTKEELNRCLDYVYDLESYSGIRSSQYRPDNNKPPIAISDPYYSTLKQRSPLPDLQDPEHYRVWKSQFPDFSLEEFDRFLSVYSPGHEIPEKYLQVETLLKWQSANHSLAGTSEFLEATRRLFRTGGQRLSPKEFAEKLERAWPKTPLQKRLELVRAIDFKKFSSPYVLGDLIDSILETKRPAEMADRAVKDRLLVGKKRGEIPRQLVGTMTASGIQTYYETLDYLAKKLDFQAGQKFVDVGSAYGRVGNFLALRGYQLDFKGYEIAPEKVAVSRQVSQKLGFSNNRYFVQDLMDPKFELPPADYYYFFDPTTDEVRRKVIQDIKSVAQKNKKPFRIIAISGWSENILTDFDAESAWLTPIDRFKSGGYAGKIYEYRGG